MTFKGLTDTFALLCDGMFKHTVMSLTFVAVADGVEVHVVLLVGEEEQTEPRVEGVDGHDEEDAHDVPLLIRSVIITQVHVDLRHTHRCQLLHIHYHAYSYSAVYYSSVNV